MEMGTEILLARMKEYPEEFINVNDIALGYDGLRWDRVLRDARDHLPKEDIVALDAGIKQLYVDRFNERVLKVLAGESEPEQTEGTITYKTQGRYTTGMTNAIADARSVYGGMPVEHIEKEYQNQLKQYEAEQQRQMMNSQRGMMNSAQNTLSNGANGMFGRLFGKGSSK
jgi:hypothetical protein